jgi:hypothetical protein
VAAFGVRPADPPFPRSVRLLGRAIPLTAPRGMPQAQRGAALAIARAAAAKLDADEACGRLAAEDIRCLRALRRFAICPGRSGQHRGCFTFGLKDVRASQDADYWASALVHDGAHAALQARGRPYRDEVGPCEAQIDYLARTAADPALIAHIARFRDSRAGQRRRVAEPI